MNIEYAKDALLKMEAPKHVKPFPAQVIVEAFAAEKEFLVLADKLGDEKISGIVETVRSTEKNRWAKVTHKQKYALAAALLEEYKTARAVYASAFGVSEEEMFGKAGLESIALAKEERIHFSQGAMIACIVEIDGDTIMSASVSGEQLDPRSVTIEDCFLASEEALAECRKSGMGTTIMTTINERGEVIVVSIKEARANQLVEVDLVKLNGIWVAQKGG